MKARISTWTTLPPEREEDEFGPSKTQRKAEMHELQKLGKALTELSVERIKKVPMSERLLEAFLDMHKITKGEARRRQLQFIGRLMRDEDDAPIRAALEAVKGKSRVENARMHRLEAQRDRLLADESILTEIGNAHPGADLSRLRQLRRNAIKEHAENRPPKSYREIYQLLREIDGMQGASHIVDDVDGDEDEANDD